MTFLAAPLISSSTMCVWCLTTSTPARNAASTISNAVRKLPSWLMPISATTSGGWAKPIFRPAIEISACGIGGVCLVQGGASQEELLNQCLQLGDRLHRIDADAELSTTVEPLRVPGTKGANLVDDPAFTADRFPLIWRGVACAGRRGMPEPRGLVDVLVQQQLHVVEQELATLVIANHSRPAPFDQIPRLREDPGIA